MYEKETRSLQPITVNAANIVFMHKGMMTNPPMVGTVLNLSVPPGKMMVKNDYDAINICLATARDHTLIIVPLEITKEDDDAIPPSIIS